MREERKRVYPAEEIGEVSLLLGYGKEQLRSKRKRVRDIADFLGASGGGKRPEDNYNRVSREEEGRSEQRGGSRLHIPFWTKINYARRRIPEDRFRSVGTYPEGSPDNSADKRRGKVYPVARRGENGRRSWKGGGGENGTSPAIQWGRDRCLREGEMLRFYTKGGKCGEKKALPSQAKRGRRKRPQ